MFNDSKWFLEESLKIILQNQNYNMIPNYPSSFSWFRGHKNHHTFIDNVNNNKYSIIPWNFKLWIKKSQNSIENLKGQKKTSDKPKHINYLFPNGILGYIQH